MPTLVGQQDPQVLASSIARPETPITSVATAASLILAASKYKDLINCQTVDTWKALNGFQGSRVLVAVRRV